MPTDRARHSSICSQPEPHDRIGLLLNNSQNSVLIDFACLKARLTRMPLNSRLAVAEQTKMLTIAGAKTLVYGPDLVDVARELQTALPYLKLLGLGTNAHGEDLLTLAQTHPNTRPDAQAEPGDVVLAIFTSGTTGKLKAVQHTQASYAGIVLNILLNLPDIRRGDVMLHAASLIHASGTFVVPYWLRGGASAVLPGFTPASYFDAIEKWRPAALNMVPTMLGMLLEQNRAADIDMSSVRTLIYGASPMPRPVIKRPSISGARVSCNITGRPRRRSSSRICAPRIISAKTPTRGCSPAAGRARIAKSAWSIPTATTCHQVRAARSRCVRHSRSSTSRSSTRRRSCPAASYAPATSAALTKPAFSISSIVPPT